MAKKKMDRKTEFLSVRVSEATKNSLEEIAESEDRSLSWLVAKVLEDYLKIRKKKDRRTRRSDRIR